MENKPPKAALSRGSRAKFIDNKLLSIELLISKKEHCPYFSSTQPVLRDYFFRSLLIWFSLIKSYNLAKKSITSFFRKLPLFIFKICPLNFYLRWDKFIDLGNYKQLEFCLYSYILLIDALMEK